MSNIFSSLSEVDREFINEVLNINIVKAHLLFFITHYSYFVLYYTIINNIY